MATSWYSFDLGKIISERLLCLSGRGEIFKPSDNLIDFLEAVALEKEDELIHGQNGVIKIIAILKYNMHFYPIIIRAIGTCYTCRYPLTFGWKKLKKILKAH